MSHGIVLRSTQEPLRLRRVLEFVAYACTLVSVPLAIYFYYQSVSERAPMYYVSPQRTRIVDTSIPAPSQLQVLYRGKDLNANVSAVTLYIWNDGKLPIKAEDVLEPLKVQLEAGCEILDARLLKVSRTLTNLAKGEVPETEKNSISMSFRILERGDGAALQIIYTGKPDTAVSVKGAIVGAGEPRILPHNDSPFAKRTRKQQKWRSTRVSYAFFFLTLLTLFFAGFRTWTVLKSGNKLRLAHYLLILTAVVYVATALFMIREDRLTFQPGVPASIWVEE